MQNSDIFPAAPHESVEIQQSESQYSEAPNQSSQDIKKSDFQYQAQKLVINQAENEEQQQTSTYKDFFAKDFKRTVATENDDGDKKDSPQRWEVLYQKAKRTQEAKREILKQQANQVKEDPECTFKPQLVSFDSKIAMVKASEAESDVPIPDRTKLWKDKISKKVSDTRDLYRDRDLHSCTFQPDLSKTQGKEHPVKTLTEYGAKGVDQYLRRKIIAKQNSDEKNGILNNPLQKLPAHVYKKDGKITYPVAPEFIRAKEGINSLKKPIGHPTVKSARVNQILSASYSSEALSPQKLSQQLVDPVEVNAMTFGDAIQLLHKELHSIQLD